MSWMRPNRYLAPRTSQLGCGRRAGVGQSYRALKCFGRELLFVERAGAEAEGRLQIVALELDARPIAMLVNFVTPPGSFSFKTAFDEKFARFSPGVLIQIENLRILAREDIAWTDSCAVEDHAMINSLWRERRSLVRLTVPLAGRRRRAIFAAARMMEKGSALLRRLKGAKT